MKTTVGCSCGGVELAIDGAPITTLICHCDDCQAAARGLESNGARVLDDAGGTPYVVLRRDRVRCAKGEAFLERRKLRPESSTYRAVARCCGTPMLLGFDDGKHWVDIHRARFGADAPPVEMRVSTKFASGAVPDDVPRFAGYPARFAVKLLAARVAMLFDRAAPLL